ncbi:MAG: hypothetical protein ACRCZP_06935 [Phycicoccus sp.]
MRDPRLATWGRMRAAQQRRAAELRARGWVCVEPPSSGPDVFPEWAALLRAGRREARP